MVEIFDKVGFGQWFRYFTGIMEVSSAVCLLIPRYAFYGAVALAMVMIGAIIAQLTVLEHSLGAPVVLLVIAGAIAYLRKPAAAHRGRKTGARMSRTIGIRPQPDQVADELAIRALAYAFTDAVNRRDAGAFESLWDEHGVWEIGAPLHSIANGAANIAAHMIELAEPLEFFVQQVHSGVVAIDGDQATARWSVQETGRARSKGPYNNHAFYEDQLVKRDGAWRFVRRSYRYVWLDLKSPIGGDVYRVGDPATTSELERQNMSNHPNSEAIDYNRLMQANLTRVFNERDAGRRVVAIRELYAEDAVLYEPDASAKGHAAISEAVTALLAQLPPNFVFSAAGPAIGHHNLGRLKWRSGPPDGPLAVTGMDVAHFEEGRIHSIYVFLEPAGA